MAKKEEKKTEKKTAPAPAKKTRVKKKKIRRTVPHGHAHILAGFNNTIVTITDESHATLCWASSGGSGFKGARKSTPYAAQVAAKNAAEKSKEFGLETVDVFVKGIGPGREQAVRGLSSAGVDVLSITDRTTTAHGGCRKKKPRRV
ncbi:30S ribosomal protein S11 [Candidatus Gracilibacteria bacterium]|nr:30S ribosomal protein S11 [Candidatus Gracilibacteria bacterium]MCF7897125.1 30S ribosomal protein S11 [Candidatus Gracilibacteria bacterium]